jgi:mRNA interferase MazF
MKRAEIWWAALEVPGGSEPGYRRPVVIVSNNVFNDSAFKSVLTVPLTGNLTRELAPGNVRIPTKGTGLGRASIALPIQVQPTDKRKLVQRIGRVPDALMRDIDNGLRLIFAL